MFYCVFFPTQSTIIIPVPSRTLVPEIKKQFLLLLGSNTYFAMVLDYPVIEL